MRNEKRVTPPIEKIWTITLTLTERERVALEHFFGSLPSHAYENKGVPSELADSLSLDLYKAFKE